MADAAYGEGFLAALARLGRPATRVLDLQNSHGQASPSTWKRKPSLRTCWRWSTPNFAHMMGGLVDGYDFDPLFETGLRALLDGFERLIDRERTT